MSNLPLQPINWRTFKSIVGVSCDATTPICEYDVWQSDGSWVVEYYNRQTEEPTKIATGFATLDDAKTWAWDHYNEKMQPYVKQMPTWIDASERLPEEDGLYLALRKGFTFEMGNASDLVPKVSGWNGGRGCFDDDHGNVLITHWMPVPEFSTMQNLHKGEVM